jgi:hypothetical protein
MCSIEEVFMGRETTWVNEANLWYDTYPSFTPSMAGAASLTHSMLPIELNKSNLI